MTERTCGLYGSDHAGISNDKEGEKKHELVRVSATELVMKSIIEGMTIMLVMKKV